MRAAACIAVLIALAGCSRCAKKPAADAPAEVEQQVVAEEPPPRFDARPSDLIVGMIGEPYQEDPVTVHAMRVTDRGVEMGRALAVPRRDRELPAATVHGRYMYLARGTGVERREPFTTNPAASVNLGQAPASLLGLGTGCLAGLEGRVDLVDFSGGKGEVRTLFADKEIRKPVDFLVPLGESAFVAVDDVVTPKYAFVFDLVPGDVAGHRFTAELPAGANERYLDVAVRGDELVITASFGVLDGSGNTLYRWSVEKKEASCRPHEEFEPRSGLDEPVKLLAGDQMTYWQGLGVIGDHAFIGAGARGVLHTAIPVEDAALFDAGGYVLDLVVSGSRILVLTAELVEKGDEVDLGQRHVVELVWDGETLSGKARHPLQIPIDWLTL
jgi:hypothetical protein